MDELLDNIDPSSDTYHARESMRHEGQNNSNAYIKRAPVKYERSEHGYY
jgi:hypothetical protein